MMTSTPRIFLCLLAILFCVSANSQSLLLFETPPSTTDCSNYVLGDNLTLQRGALCGVQIGIVMPNGVNIIADSDTTIVLDQVGEYQILCNTPGGSTLVSGRRTFEFAACLSVAATAVPTLEQWSILCLLLILAIFGVARVKEISIDEMSLVKIVRKG